MTNREDARGTAASNVRAKLILPSGFTTFSANPQSTGTLTHYSSWGATWWVNAPSPMSIGDTYTFDVEVWSDNLGVEVDDFDNPYHKFDVYVSSFPIFDIWDHIFDRLVWFLPDGDIQPMLAKFWEISEDGMEVIFHLREGVLFHNGEPFNSEVVLFNLEKEIPLLPDYLRPPLIESELIESLEVIDDYTFKISLAQPEPEELLSLLAGPAGMLASPSAVEELGQQFEYYPVGAGPFKLEELMPEELAVLEPFEEYWDGPPHVEKLVYRIILEEAARYVGLMAGELQAMVGQNPGIYDELAASPEFIVCGIPMDFQAVSTSVEGFECYPDGVMRFRDVWYPDALVVGLPSF